MAIYGYARVSTTDQDTAIQVEALTGAGCTVVRQENVSGASREGRGELDLLMQFIRPGDTLMVHKLDRLGRSTRDVLNIVHELEGKGAHLRVLEPAIDTSDKTGIGKIMVTVLGMVADMELGFIKARQRDGIAKAKADGVYKGRKVTVDHELIRSLNAIGKGATAIATAARCSRAMVYKVLKAPTQSQPQA
jgi:DNA invertase Pin-like site-specific DNA recombinase